MPRHNGWQQTSGPIFFSISSHAFLQPNLSLLVISLIVYNINNPFTKERKVLKSVRDIK